MLVLAFFALSIGSMVAYDRWLKDLMFPPEDQFNLQWSLIQLTARVDSLDEEVGRKDEFINSFKLLLGSGDLLADTLAGVGKGLRENIKVENSLSSREIDSLFKLEFESGKEKVGHFRIGPRDNLPQMFFFPPISGIITRNFESKTGHWGVDLVAKENEPVKSVADGTVIMSSWTEDSGYVIVIQHRNNLLSVYKHNSELLKKVGNFVTDGEVIALIGNTGELTSGPHLHFEIWYNGNPVNPEEFISFN
jgi:murein DD-endopeptidase MepM/ murein hydrolase activator NlpD